MDEPASESESLVELKAYLTALSTLMIDVLRAIDQQSPGQLEPVLMASRLQLQALETRQSELIASPYAEDAARLRVNLIEVALGKR